MTHKYYNRFPTITDEKLNKHLNVVDFIVRKAIEYNNSRIIKALSGSYEYKFIVELLLPRADKQYLNNELLAVLRSIK